MRREVGSMEEVSPGVWRLRVSVGHSTVTGKRRRPSVTVRGDERQASMAFAKLLLEAGRLPEEDVSVRQFLVDMYLPHVEGRLRARTVDGYRSKIEIHILNEPAFADNVEKIGGGGGSGHSARRATVPCRNPELPA